MKQLLRFRNFTIIAILLFVIQGNVISQPFVEVIQPSELGITWELGTTKLISWNSNFTQPVKLELYKNAVLHSEIAASVTGSTYSWEITDPLILAGNDYKVRVSSTVNPAFYAESDNNFSLVVSLPSSYIHVEQPNIPGITWIKGATHLISWVDEVPGPVNIELISTVPFNLAHDDAADYAGVFTIGTNEGYGFGPWSIIYGTISGGVATSFTGDPSVAGISGMDNPSFGIATYSNTMSVDNYVYADRFFTNPLELEQTFSIQLGMNFSNGGVSAADGTKGLVLYSGGIGSPNAITIEQGHDDVITINGAPMFSVAGTEKITLNFEYVSTGNLRVYGVGRDGAETYDQTLAFTGAPDAFRLFSTGQLSDLDVAKRALYFNHIKITALKMDIANNVVGSTFPWEITSGFPLGSGVFKVRVSSVADPLLLDESDNFFSIGAAESGGTIEVLQPSVAGITWLKGSSYLISWIDDVSGTVKIQLFKGGIFNSTIAASVVGSTYVWAIPGGTATGSDYTVKVISNIDNGVVGVSANPFTISNSMPDATVTVLQPSELGIIWLRGSSHLISWNDNIPGTVDIYLTSGGPDQLLVSNVVGTTWVWDIPLLTYATGNYKIKVVATNGSVFGESTNTFALADFPTGGTIEVLQPSLAGIKLLRGTTYLVSWTGSTMYPVKIELFKGGLLDHEIVTGVTGSVYYWEIPALQTTGLDYKIKVTTLGSGITGSSSNDFEIAATLGGTIEVLQPNGGETLGIGSAYLISWIDDVTESVNIDLIDAVSVYPYTVVQNIATSVLGSTHAWNITSPTFVAGNYRVLVSSTIDPSINDVSNAPFTLVALPLAPSVYPNPANNLITIKFDPSSKGEYLVQLKDRFNMTVSSKLVNVSADGEINIATSQLPNGVYFLTISTDTTKTTQKVIVKH